jgi:hypothetical protein
MMTPKHGEDPSRMSQPDRKRNKSGGCRCLSPNGMTPRPVPEFVFDQRLSW